MPPRFEGAAKQQTYLMMTLLLLCGRLQSIAAEPALPGYSPNMCVDVKDRYDVDLWRRKSGSIRFPIGAWSSPIGVYSLGTPAILAAYASANFSVLEISGGALGPVDPLTQWNYVTNWTLRAEALDMRVMLDTYSYAKWAPWNLTSGGDHEQGTVHRADNTALRSQSEGRLTITPEALLWLLNHTTLLHEGTISMMLFNDDVSRLTSTEKDLSAILQSQPSGKKSVMPWVNSIGRECSVLSHYGFPYYIGELYDVKNGHGTPEAMAAAQLERFTLARDSSTRWRVEPMPLFNTGNGGHYIVQPFSLDTFQALAQVALGARGLMYYTWGSIWVPQPNSTTGGKGAMWDDVSRANRKIQSFAPYLYFARHAEGAYHTGWPVGGILSLGEPKPGAVVEGMDELLMASVHTADPHTTSTPPVEDVDWDRSVLLMVVDKRVNISCANSSRLVNVTLSPLVSSVVQVGAINHVELQIHNNLDTGTTTVTLELLAGDAAMLLLTSEANQSMAAADPLVHLAREQLQWSFDKTQANLAPIDVAIGAASCCRAVTGVLDVVRDAAELSLARQIGAGILHAAWSPQNDSTFAELISGGQVLAVVPGVDHSATPRVATNPLDVGTASSRYWCKSSVGAAVALGLQVPLSDTEKYHLSVLATEAKHGLPRGINSGSTASIAGVEELAKAGVVLPILMLSPLTSVDATASGQLAVTPAEAEKLAATLATLQSLNASELGFTRSVSIDVCQPGGAGARLQSSLAMAYGARSLWFHNVFGCNASHNSTALQPMLATATELAGEFATVGETLLQNEVTHLVTTATWTLANATDTSSSIIHHMDSDLLVSFIGRTATTADINATGILVVDTRLESDPMIFDERSDANFVHDMQPRCHPCNTRHCRVPCAPPTPKANTRTAEVCVTLNSSHFNCKNLTITPGQSVYLDMAAFRPVPGPPAPPAPAPPPPLPPPPAPPPPAKVLPSNGWVWPYPQTITTSGDELPLANTFQFALEQGLPTASSAVQRLQRGAARYLGYLKVADGPSAGLAKCTVGLDSTSDALGLDTLYNYSLKIDQGECTIRGGSVYGALYAFETFAQLANVAANGSHTSLPNQTVLVRDWPMYKHRALMIDAGRRFFPVQLLKDILNSMSFVKMNVLHLHAVDFCRFGIESKQFPQLLGDCESNATGARCLKHGSFEGYYRQTEIAELVAYAQDLGIRVIPEIEQPEHSYGYDFLAGKTLPNGTTDGSGMMEFCTGAMMYNDPANKTVNTLKQIYTEMVSLFPDAVFHMGGDEPYCVNQCTLESVQRMEGEMARHVVSLGKTPMGWEEILFRTSGAQATPNKTAIVASWATSSAAQIVKAGYRAVEANAAHFYLSSRLPGHNVPTAEENFWYDISTGVDNASDNPHLLGGSMSFWTDEFSTCHQGESRGAALFPRAQDINFARAATGMLWPRGYMGAGSFWHYFPLNMTMGPSNSTPTFMMQLYNLNTRFRTERNVSNCHCDVETCPAQGCTFDSGCEYGRYA